MSFFENYGSDFYLYHVNCRGNSGIMHLHPHWEMLICHAPEPAVITANGTEVTGDRPFLAIFAPYCLHAVEFRNFYSEIERFVCYFGDDLINCNPQVFSVYPDIFKKNFAIFSLTDEQAEKCKAMIDLSKVFEHNSKEQKLLFLLVLSYVLNKSKPQSSSDSLSNDLQISTIIKYMFEHLSEKIDADSVAQQFYMSRSKLDKDFQKYTTVSFRQLLIDMRLSHAAYLLVNTKMKISDIASLSGFENENYFYAQFKKLMGTTPLKFQKDPGKYIRLNAKR